MLREGASRSRPISPTACLGSLKMAIPARLLASQDLGLRGLDLLILSRFVPFRPTGLTTPNPWRPGWVRADRIHIYLGPLRT